MPDLDAKIWAALIAGLISLVVSWIAVRKERLKLRHDAEKFEKEHAHHIEILRTQKDLQDREFDLKVRDFAQREQAAETSRKHWAAEMAMSNEKLRSEIDNARHSLRDTVLERKATAYAEVYQILQRNNRIYRWKDKPMDHDWAKSFLRDLLEVNAKHGLFFSEEVYKWFRVLRSELYGIEARLKADGGEATEEEITRIDAAISGPMKPSGQERYPGLGTAIKDELGSYLPSPLSAAPREKN